MLQHEEQRQYVKCKVLILERTNNTEYNFQHFNLAFLSSLCLSGSGAMIAVIVIGIIIILAVILLILKTYNKYDHIPVRLDNSCTLNVMISKATIVLFLSTSRKTRHLLFLFICEMK